MIIKKYFGIKRYLVNHKKYRTLGLRNKIMFLIVCFLSMGINAYAMLATINPFDLAPERWEEFRALRIDAVTNDPQGIGGSVQDEEIRPLESYKKLLEDAQHGNNMWLSFAQDEDKLIGVAGAICKMAHLSACRHVATLISVYVKPTYRGFRIGEILVRSVLEKLRKSEHVTEVMLFVTTTQKAAIELYKKLGFIKCGEHKNALYINGRYYDQDIMQIHIDKNYNSFSIT